MYAIQTNRATDRRRESNVWCSFPTGHGMITVSYDDGHASCRVIISRITYNWKTNRLILEKKERLGDDERKSKDESPAVRSGASHCCRTHLKLNLQDDVDNVAQCKCLHFDNKQKRERYTYIARMTDRICDFPCYFKITPSLWYL